MGTQLPSPKREQIPNFLPIFIVAKRLDASRCHLVWGLGLRDIVLDGDLAPPKRGAASSFRFLSVVAKRLDGRRHHLVRTVDGDQALHERGTEPPLFSTHVYCGHDRPSQLLLSCCLLYSWDRTELAAGGPILTIRHMTRFHARKFLLEVAITQLFI